MKRICLRSAVTCHGKIHDVARPHRLGVLIKEAHKKRKVERQQKLRQATRREGRGGIGLCKLGYPRFPATPATGLLDRMYRGQSF